jgi:hypothetical protein
VSDVSNGPGWWQASDGKWYPPQAPVAPQAFQTPPPPQDMGSSSFSSDAPPLSTPSFPPTMPAAPSYGASAPQYGAPPSAPQFGAPQYGTPQFGGQPGFQGMATAPKAQGLAITALVLGILALLTSWFLFGLIFAVLGLVFGAIALAKKQSKGMAIAGIVMSVLGILSAIAVVALVKEVADTVDSEQFQNYLDTIPVEPEA